MGISTLGIVGTPPGSFVRVPNKGVAGYGTWKRIRKMGDKRSKGNRNREPRRTRWLARPFAQAALGKPFARNPLGKMSLINHDPCCHKLSRWSNTIILPGFSD